MEAAQLPADALPAGWSSGGAGAADPEAAQRQAQQVGKSCKRPTEGMRCGRMGRRKGVRCWLMFCSFGRRCCRRIREAAFEPALEVAFTQHVQSTGSAVNQCLNQQYLVAV